MHPRFLFVMFVCLCANTSALADVTLPALFTDHMVLQRDRENRVWGGATPGEEVTLTIADQTHTARANDQGRWEVTLDKLPAGGPHEMKIAGKNTRTISDILVGEVWLCSGQSNMQWSVGEAFDGDLESLVADNPRIRLITLPQVGTQEPQTDFKGSWQLATPASVKNFSAVGYYFGKQLADSLDVPIGLIDNAWGGSACEAWVKRDLLANDERFQKMHEDWKQIEATYDYNQKLAEYEEQRKKWEAGDKKNPAPWQPENAMTSKNRPANLYNGMLHPLLGYGLRGAIWYQGESNADRAYQYRDLFPLMIQNWRDDWKIGDFPFYWVQLADFMPESPEPADSAWAELREAQTMALDKLPNVGQAVIVDLGEANDIHPRNKRDVALRLARLALARDYGMELAHESPRYQSMKAVGNKVVLTFNLGQHSGRELRTYDASQPVGFTISGADRKFVPAQAKLIGPGQVEVWSDAVAEPVAVRYAWANNPVCNLRNRAGLPAVPFRTDDWPGVTAPK